MFNLFQPYGYGNGYMPPLPYSIFDQYLFSGYPIRPQPIVYNIYDQRKHCDNSKKLFKRGGRYYVTERSGHEVDIGVMNISNPLVVNPHKDGTFDCVYCEIQGEGMQEKRACKFPMEAIRKHNPLPYIPDYHRNLDGQDQYITAAFFEELFTNNDIKFLNLPPRSGWNLIDNRWCFVSAESMIPQLVEYYPPDIPLRQMPQTDKPLQEAAAELSALLPDNDACRTLVNANVSSGLLGIYEEQQHKPDRVIVVVVDCERNAKLATVLLQNRSFSDTYTCSLLENKTKLEDELGSIWDGMVVFRDSSYLENHKRRDASIDVVLHELHRGMGISEVPRKIITIITNNPACYSSELPAVFIDMSRCPEVEELEAVQLAIGTFHAALIRTLEQADRENNLVTGAIKRTPVPQKTVENSGEIGLETIMRCTDTLLSEVGLFDSRHTAQLDKTFRCGTEAAFDLNRAVVNNFRSVLSAMIENGELGVANQFAPPYFTDSSNMVMLDSEYVNFTNDVINKITAKLHTTQRRITVLRALTAEGKLHANNNFKRKLDFEIEPGYRDDLYFYSVPRTILTQSCQAKLNELRFADYLFSRSDFPPGYVPIVRGETGLAAGRVSNDQTDEAESIYASGKTRSGKTHFLLQQAIIRADAGERIIVFDQTGAFSRDELGKHLPEEIIEEYFSIWELGERGVPVNLLSLENCKRMSEKKGCLRSTLGVLARLTGEIQLKTLSWCAAKIAHAIDAGKVHGLSDTLKYFDEREADQADIRERLAEAFDDLEGLPSSQLNWGDFLASQSRIVVISTASDGIRKSTQYVDALLASLYAWKQHNRTGRMTVVLDELKDLYLEQDGPIDTILCKAGKHRLSMLLASQDYSADKDQLGKLIGNCGLQVFFHPKDNCIDEIAKAHGISRQQLAAMEQGECFAVGGFFSRQFGKNKKQTIHGTAYSAADFLAPVEPPTEAQEILDESPELPSNDTIVQFEETLPESADLCDLSLISPAPDKTETSTQEMQQSQPSETVNDEPEMESSESVESSTAETTKAEPSESIPETEEQPLSPEEEPAEPEKSPQELIEQELQQQFRELKRRFSPDYPSWLSYLAEFFEVFLDKHHFENPSERERIQGRLHGFLYVSSDSFDYRDRLEALFKELCPDS